MGPVGDAVRAELTEMRVLDSVEAQVALRLAEQLDAPRNGMAVAGDARELRAVLAVIRDSQPKAGDGVDEFTARRSARRSAAGM